MTVGRIIKGDACVAEGAAYLAAHFPEFKRALVETGPLQLRLKSDGFEPLLDAIVSQQISVASANAVRTRLSAAKFTTPKAIQRASDEDLKGCGLSRPKLRYARALSENNIDYNALRTEPDTVVIGELTKLLGIGTWTAEIYAMFSLGRADVFAHGDLALQEAAKVLFDLPERPNEKHMVEMAHAWSPWRSVAARTLWAYYRVIKNREGISE